MASLTLRQEQELHKALLDYALTAGYQQTSEALKSESPHLKDYDWDPNGKTNGLLVKKWTSIIRLQKKIVDLEARLSQAKEEIANMGTLPANGGKGINRDWLPTNASVKHVLAGHREAVTAIAFHPVFSSVATASDDVTVKIWDWESGEMEMSLRGHTRRVTDCDYDSKGKLLVTASADLQLRLWNVDEGYKNCATLMGHEHSVSSGRFLPGDATIVSAGRDNTIRIWEVATTHCIKVIKTHDDWILQAIPSLDGKFILSCSKDHTARVTDADSGATKVEMRGHENNVEVALFATPASVPFIRELLAIPSSGPSARAGGVSIAYVFTASRDKTIRLWDGIHGRCLWTFVGHDDWVRALTFHPTGKYLLSASDDHTIRAWDLRSGRCVKKIDAHEKFVQCLKWAPSLSTNSEGDDGEGMMRNLLASGGSDKVVKIWAP